VQASICTVFTCKKGKSAVTKRVYSEEELAARVTPEWLDLGQPGDSLAAAMAPDFGLSPSDDHDAAGLAEAGKGRKNRNPSARDDTNGKDKVIEAGDDNAGDAKAKGNALKNDRDRDGDDLKVLKPGTFEGEFGTLKIAANGKFTYKLDNADPNTDALAGGEKATDVFKYRVSDGHGGKDVALIKIKITGQDDAPPAAAITVNAVTADSIVNASEAGGTIAISGTVGGDVKDGDTVTLVVNGKSFAGAVASGAFSIDVPGSDLAADTDTTVDASVTTGTAGNTTTATDTEAYTVDTAPPAATVTIDPVTADNILNAAESGDDVVITGAVGGDVQDGDTVTLTINGKPFTGTVTAGTFSIAVPGADLAADPDATIEASVTKTDAAGNAGVGTDTQAYVVDVTAPAVTIAIDPVTADNVVNLAESGGDVAVTGTVTIGNNGDTVTLTINGKAFSGTVSSGTFSILVPGSDLGADAEKTIEASISTVDTAGNPASATDSQIYSVDTTLPSGSILLNAVTADNTLNASEAAGTVDVTGVVGGDFADGEAVTLVVNGETYTGEVLDGKFSIAVSGSDLAADADKTIDASIGTITVATDTQAYAVDTTPPAASVAIDAITADNIVNVTEASGSVSVTGTVGGDVKDGDTVSLVVNGTTYTGTVSSGTFSISVLGADLAADGDATVAASVTTTDAAGNTASATDTQSYTIDATPPEGSIFIDPITADNIVNAAEAAGQVNVTGVVGANYEDGDIVTLAINGKTVTGALSGGAFSIAVEGSDLVADPDATIAASVTGVNGSGNTVTASDTQTYLLRINPPEPVIFLDAVAADNIVNLAEASGNIAVTGTVSGAQNGDTVTLEVNGASYSGAVSAGTFSISVKGSDLAADTQVVANVVSSDIAGNIGTSTDTQAYTVDTTLPSAAILLDPVTADNIVNAQEGSNVIQITGVAGGDFKTGDIVTLTLNGATYESEVLAGKFSFGVNGAELLADADRTMSVSASTSDGSGNTITATDTQTYSVDIVAPTATITLDAITADNIVNAVEASENIIVTGTVGGDVKNGDTVIIEINGVSHSGTVAAGKFSISVLGADFLADTDKTVLASVTTTDAAGNATTVSDTQAYTVDTVAPAGLVVLDVVTADNVVNIAEASGNVAITGIVGADFENGDTVQLTINEKIFTGAVSGGKFSISVAGSDLTADADKTILASVSGSDGAGNTIVATDTQTYAVDTVLPTPTITLDPIAGDGILNIAEKDSGAVAITGTVGGDAKDGDTVVVTTSDFVFSTTVFGGKFSVNIDGNVLATSAPLQIDATVVTTDAAGNTATVAAFLPYTLDLTAPTASIALDPITADNVINIAERDGTVTLTGTVGGDVKNGDSVRVFMNETFFSGTVNAGKFSIDIPGVNFPQDSDVTLDVTVTTADAAGNATAASATASYTLDLTAPTASITLDPITGDGVVNIDEAAGNITLSGTVGGDVKEGDTVRVTMNETQFTGVVDVGTGTFSLNVAGFNFLQDADSTLDISVTTADSAGNTATASAVGTYTLDQTAPFLEITIDPITADNVINIAEKDGGTIAVTGTVTGEVNDGDPVDLTINGKTFSGLVAAGKFSIAVPSADLLDDPAKTVEASVVTLDAAGNQGIAETSKTYEVDITPLDLGLALDAIAGDDILDAIDVTGDVAISGTVSSEVVDGTFVSLEVNGVTVNAEVVGGAFSALVKGSDIVADAGQDITATMTETDAAGNPTIAAVRAYTVNFDIDVRTLNPARGFIIFGEGETGVFADEVAGIGDINGDGLADVGVGGPRILIEGQAIGAVAGILGTTLPPGTLDGDGRMTVSIADNDLGAGFIGPNVESQVGGSIAAAGDVNGDGFDDFLIGAPLGNTSGSITGEAYVVFGAGTEPANVALGTLATSAGFVIIGDAVNDDLGFSVSGAGDFNGDGLEDIIVAAPSGDDGGDFAGEAYVIFGTTGGFGTEVGGRNVIDLTTLSASTGFIIKGDEENANAAFSVSSAGDVNGDGLDDLIIGAPNANIGDLTNQGEAYIVFGTNQTVGTPDGAARQVLDIATLSAAQGFVIQGEGENDNAGFSVASAGDVNGDGFDDLIIGAPQGNLGGLISGQAYVVFGTDQGFGTEVGGRRVVELASLTGEKGFILTGESDDVATGYSVSSAGDVNGDGFDDMLVGASGVPRDGQNNAGKAYVLFGNGNSFGTVGTDGRSSIDLGNLTISQGFQILGANAGDEFGRSVSSAGDVNGDGFDDIIVAAASGDIGGADRGEAYIIYGAAYGVTTTGIISDGDATANLLNGTAGDDILAGGGGADVFYAGAGNDRIRISDGSFRRIDGGSGGDDRVEFAGTGFVLDLKTIANSRISGIEAFDMRGAGANRLDIDASDMFDFSTDKNALFTGTLAHKSLVVFGDSDDIFTFTATGSTGAWVQVGQNLNLDGSADGDFRFFNLVEIGSGDLLASLAVENDILL
jgi:VCBS repeat-containing protein